MALTAAISERLALGRRFDHWLLERIRSRRGPSPLPLTLEYGHIYVLPTRFGIGFGLLLAVMALGGLNFNNNMTLMMVFVVGATAVLSMLLAYRNVVGIRIGAVLAPPVFLGDDAEFHVLVRNPDQRHRFAVQLRGPGSMDCGDIEPEGSRHLVLRQATVARGWMGMAPYRIENRFPLGLFRAWTVIIPESRCLVYPRPAPNPPPLPKSGLGDQGRTSRGEGEQIHGLREYRPGDPLRRIAWRASARHQKLYSREMEAPKDDACELNWYLMGAGDVEDKLSILTAWVLRAEHRQVPYSLELPGAALPADLGPQHRDACLELLALFNGEGAA